VEFYARHNGKRGAMAVSRVHPYSIAGASVCTRKRHRESSFWYHSFKNRKLLNEQCRVERPLLSCLWFLNVLLELSLYLLWRSSNHGSIFDTRKRKWHFMEVLITVTNSKTLASTTVCLLRIHLPFVVWHSFHCRHFLVEMQLPLSFLLLLLQYYY